MRKKLQHLSFGSHLRFQNGLGSTDLENTNKKTKLRALVQVSSQITFISMKVMRCQTTTTTTNKQKSKTKQKTPQIQRKSEHKVAFPSKWLKCRYDLLAFTWWVVLTNKSKLMTLPLNSLYLLDPSVCVIWPQRVNFIALCLLMEMYDFISPFLFFTTFRVCFNHRNVTFVSKSFLRMWNSAKQPSYYPHPAPLFNIFGIPTSPHLITGSWRWIRETSVKEDKGDIMKMD